MSGATPKGKAEPQVKTDTENKPVASLSALRTRTRRKAIIGALTRIPKTPWTVKIVAILLGLFFVYLFVNWALWALFGVVIPRLSR